MSDSSQFSQQPLGPLSVGNVISAAIRLYRSHFKAYLKISLRATLWTFFPFLGLLVLGIVIAIIGIVLGEQGIPIAVLLGLVLGLGWLVFLIFCVAKYFKNAGAIARNVYQELINQPESVTQSHAQLNGNWIFWLLQFVVFLCLLAVQIILNIIQAIVVGIPLLLSQNEIIRTVVEPLISLIMLIPYYWFYGRLFIPELPLVVEPINNSVGKAVERSWQLSQGSAWRIVLIVFVAGLITIPLFLAPFIVLVVVSIPLFASVETGNPSPAVLTGFAIGVLVAIIIFIGLNLLAMPFWQAIKGVIYYDLRTRKEGVDIQLRDSNL